MRGDMPLSVAPRYSYEARFEIILKAGPNTDTRSATLRLAGNLQSGSVVAMLMWECRPETHWRSDTIIHRPVRNSQ